MSHLVTRAEGPATAAAVRSWQVQSSAVAGLDGTVVSDARFRPAGWIDALPRSTVMAALLQAGRFPGIEFSDRVVEEVDASQFEVPWWFRTTFTSTGQARTLVRSDGIIHKADLYVNGVQVADAGVIAGAYTTNTFDVSSLVRRGTNALAYLVHPGTPKTDLSIGWVDWNVWPPDHNMGIWRDVWILRTGDVSVARPRATSTLTENRRRADLTLSVDLTNRGESPVVATVRLEVSGGGMSLAPIVREIQLATGAESRLTVSAADEPALSLPDPPIWWPLGLGDQPLLDLEITVSVGGVPSDRVATTFGIRSVESEIVAGEGRRFFVNGRPLQIMGAGWAPDLWLRHDPQRLRDELAYTVDMGLNTIRLEGKLENPEIYEIADEIGLMMMPGWECCDKWEAHGGSGEAWDEHDFDVAARSMSSAAYDLGNHPSVVGFFVGSDFPPEPRAAQSYLDAMSEAAWDVPVIPSATAEASPVAGPSGMKMTGPYAWVPPGYWYRDDEHLGGAIGFNSETGAGNNIPRLSSLRRFLSDGDLEALWRDPDARHVHAAPPSEFDNLAKFHAALAGRLGAPSDLADFLRKAQLMNYETVRAQFEAYRSRNNAERPATGMVYWMLNSAWPSLNWQLWDWYLDPAAAYFAAKKANERVHAYYAYDERTVGVLNGSADVMAPVVHAFVRSIEGEVRWERREELGGVGGGACAKAFDVEVPDGVGPAYFLECWLEGSDGDEGDVAHNVYWLASEPDELALDETTWQHTPVRTFADLRSLAGLAPAELSVRCTAGGPSGPPAGGDEVARKTVRKQHDLPATLQWAGGSTVVVTIENSGDAPAVGVHASIVDESNYLPVAPIRWSDNDVVLFAGQSVELAATLPPTKEGGPLAVEVEGFNVEERLRLRL